MPPSAPRTSLPCIDYTSFKTRLVVVVRFAPLHEGQRVSLTLDHRGTIVYLLPICKFAATDIPVTREMSSAASRAFSTPSKNALKRLAATVADVKAQNPGKDVTKVLAAIDKIEAAAKKWVRMARLSHEGSLLK